MRIRNIAKNFWLVARASGKRFSESEAPRLAASLSYYAVFSLFPLLLLLGALAESALGDSQALRSRVLGWAAGAGANGMRSVLEQTLEDVAQRAPSAAAGIGLGLVGALFGASGFVIELDAALARIFRVPRRSSTFLESLREIVRDRLMGFLVVVGTSVALLVTTLARGALELPSSVPGAALLGSAVSLVLSGGALTAGIALCYRILPRTRVPWGAVWSGAVVASLSLHAVREPLTWFVVHLTTYAAYGIIGALLGILTWFQVASCLLLFGACVAAVSGENRR